ncbi:MAG: class I SAM-dependent methyltransferase [Bacteroidia bacterium]
MDPQFYKEYYTLERTNWWFTARLAILEGILKKKISKGQTNLKILNVGVATGATSEMLSKYGTVTSVEYDEECCKFLKEKTGIEAVNASLTELPYSANQFDLVCAFDVVEHIEEDNLAVSEIRRVLKSKGMFFLTVPAYQFLWSNHDVVNHHFRRYTKSNFNSLFKDNNLKVEYSTYFNFWLFTPIAITRFILNMFKRGAEDDSSGSDNDLTSSSNIINRILYPVFKSELSLLRIGLKFPFGVSIMSIGTKS